MAKTDKLKSYKIERRDFHDKVINFFNTADNVPYNYKQVSEKVDANTPRLRHASVLWWWNCWSNCMWMAS